MRLARTAVLALLAGAAAVVPGTARAVDVGVAAQLSVSVSADRTVAPAGDVLVLVGVRNPNPVAVLLSSVRVTMPAGFTHDAGRSSASPLIDGRVLSFVDVGAVSAGGLLQVRVGMVATDVPGMYDVLVGATAGAGVQVLGNSATVEVGAALGPAPAPVVTGAPEAPTGPTGPTDGSAPGPAAGTAPHPPSTAGGSPVASGEIAAAPAATVADPGVPTVVAAVPGVAAGVRGVPGAAALSLPRSAADMNEDVAGTYGGGSYQLLPSSGRVTEAADSSVSATGSLDVQGISVAATAMTGAGTQAAAAAAFLLTLFVLFSAFALSRPST